MAGHLLFNSGSNESSLAPQFKWLDNTFKQQNKTSPMKLKSARKLFCFLRQNSGLQVIIGGRGDGGSLAAKTAIYRKLLKTLMGCSFPPPDEEKKCPMHFQMSFNFALALIAENLNPINQSYKSTYSIFHFQKSLPKHSSYAWQ
jgi:hypothetical protein